MTRTSKEIFYELEQITNTRENSLEQLRKELEYENIKWDRRQDVINFKERIQAKNLKFLPATNARNMNRIIETIFEKILGKECFVLNVIKIIQSILQAGKNLKD